MKTRAVIFDLDGTLIDSLPFVLKAFAHAMEPFAPVPTMEIFARLGGPPERVFELLLGDPQHVPAALLRLETFNRDNMHSGELFEGTSRVLARLREIGVPIAIWTGRDRGTTGPILHGHKLTGFFHTVLCGDDLPTHKPDPEGLRQILSRLEVSAAEAVLVGDADVDVLGGHACGIDTILITHGRTIASEITAKAWRTVATPGEAYQLVMQRLETEG